jgi:WD40 repeat protein
MTGHTARIIDSEFSPDGSLLVGASVDDSVIVWDVATGRPRMTVKEAHDGLISASFGPRGDRVATTGVDGILRVWEVETGEELLSIEAGSGLLGNQFSPDGKLVASGTFGGNDRAQVWDAQTGEEVLTLHHDLSVTSVKFSPDGSRLATASFDGRARVWDLRTGRELATLEGHTGWLYHIDFSSDGSRVATGSADATARVWEARTGKQLLVLSGHRGSVGNVSFSPDGTRLATGSDDGTARIWDITPEGNREVVTIPGQIDFGTNAAYTPDGTRLLAPDEEDTLGVWDASTGMLIRRFAFDKGVYDVAVDPGGDRLAVTSSRQESPRVTVADASSGQTLRVLEADTGPELLSATFSPDGTLLAAIAVGGGTAVWNAETGENLATFVHQDRTLAIHRVAFSPDGSYLATSGEGSIKLWSPHPVERYRPSPRRGPSCSALASLLTAAAWSGGWVTARPGSGRWTQAERS